MLHYLITNAYRRLDFRIHDLLSASERNKAKTVMQGNHKASFIV